MKKKTKIGAMLCCSTALVSILGGYLFMRNSSIFNFNNQASDIEKKNDNIETTIEAEKMTVKHLTTVYNRNGTISYTYSYIITPNNATHQNINGELSFIDGTQGVEDYLTFSINQETKQFTITKLADFSHQARLTLRAVTDPNVYANVTIDCKQHFLGYNSTVEKTYTKVLTSGDPIVYDEIADDGARSVNATNFSTEFTIPTTEHWSVSNVRVYDKKYISGNTEDEMMNVDLTIDESFAFYDETFTDEFTLQDLYDMVLTDSALFSDEQIAECSHKKLFGIWYIYEFTYLTAGVEKTLNSRMFVYTNTSNLNLGNPTKIEVEEPNVVFEDPIITVRFIYTDSEGEVTYLKSMNANNTGWFASPHQKYTGGYINVEVTRSFEGNIVSGPTVLYSENDGKGYYTGDYTTKQLIVWNPGQYDNITWLSIKTEFNSDFMMINNYTNRVNY